MSYIGDNAIEMEPVETDNIGSLASLILAELPECNDLIVRQQLAYALREFCRETDACVLSSPVEAMDDFFLSKIDQDANWWRGRYRLPAPPQGMEIGTVLELILHDGRSVPFKIATVPYEYVFTSEYRYSYDDRMATLRYSVYPKAGGEVCPTWFKDRYAEAITAGAMYHLLSMSGRSWSDPQRAAEYGAKYTNAIAEASYRRGAPEQGGAESAIPCGGLFM